MFIVLKSRLWGGSGVWFFEITPRRNVKKEDTRTPRRDFKRKQHQPGGLNSKQKGGARRRAFKRENTPVHRHECNKQEPGAPGVISKKRAPRPRMRD